MASPSFERNTMRSLGQGKLSSPVALKMICFSMITFKNNSLFFPLPYWLKSAARTLK